MSRELSKRLETIVSLVPKSSVVCDIGCDHAFLPIVLTERGVCDRAIAMDVNSGPLKKAGENVRANCLADRIDLRISDGFYALKPKEADCIIIAGMGGLLITDILKKGEKIWKEADCIILCPHRDDVVLREYMSDHCRYDTDVWIEEDGHFYCTMRFLPKVSTHGKLTGKQRLLGLNPTKEYVSFKKNTLLSIQKKLVNVTQTDDIIKKQEEIRHQLTVMEDPK